MTALKLKEDAIAELQSYLDSKEADLGLNDRSRQLISFISKDDDEAYKVFSDILIGRSTGTTTDTTADTDTTANTTSTTTFTAAATRIIGKHQNNQNSKCPKNFKFKS